MFNFSHQNHAACVCSCRPISDDFALVPRVFADRYFSAVSAFYSCEDGAWPPPETWWQPNCSGGGDFQESVLFRHLHATDVAYRPYPMFDFYVVPPKTHDSSAGGGDGDGDLGGERGGKDMPGCDVKTAAEDFGAACILLRTADLLPSSFSR